NDEINGKYNVIKPDLKTIFELDGFNILALFAGFYCIFCLLMAGLQERFHYLVLHNLLFFDIVFALYISLIFIRDCLDVKFKGRIPLNLIYRMLMNLRWGQAI